jgi:hypothetical protein
MAKTSPTQRTLKVLREAGYTADVVERFNHFTKTRHDYLGFAHTRIRQDLFGCLDIVAVKPGETVGVQCTSGSNAAARVTKILAEPRALAWIQGGNRLQVWGWAKRGARGKRKLWTTSVREITADEF